MPRLTMFVKGAVPLPNSVLKRWVMDADRAGHPHCRQLSTAPDTPADAG